MDLQLKGKTAIVTGATAGIGLAIARVLSEEGVEITIPGRSNRKLKEATLHSARDCARDRSRPRNGRRGR
jgi:NADP-dependent 3-hydroxy acid dehydrogenase YdfG